METPRRKRVKALLLLQQVEEILEETAQLLMKSAILAKDDNRFCEWYFLTEAARLERIKQVVRHFRTDPEAKAAFMEFLFGAGEGFPKKIRRIGPEEWLSPEIMKMLEAPENDHRGHVIH